MTDLTLFRVYEPHECGEDGYPGVWRSLTTHELLPWCEQHGSLPANGVTKVPVGVKDLVRAEAGHRCVRCGHPFVVGQSGTFDERHDEPRRSHDLLAEVGRLFYDEMAEVEPPSPRAVNWSPCDERCTHGGPIRTTMPDGFEAVALEAEDDITVAEMFERVKVPGMRVEAAWRILTVHHLNGRKHDLRWWNLCALCQRCHLVIQRKVQMERVYPLEHTEWFRPYAAGFYAESYLGESLTREEVMARLDELLALERLA